jgi:predicted AAA+ superfamily ATPase
MHQDLSTYLRKKSLNLGISELYKRVHHTGEKPPFYFWRDKTGNEINLIVDIGSKLLPIEIKASKAYSPELKSIQNLGFNPACLQS